MSTASIYARILVNGVLTDAACIHAAEELLRLEKVEEANKALIERFQKSNLELQANVTRLQKTISNLESAKADAVLMAHLTDALKRVLDDACPLTGEPTTAELVEHWLYEKSQGRGVADDMIFALQTLEKADNAASNPE